MPRRFPIYEQFLRLYPKRFRQKYGGQMVQTLADMLDDQPDHTGRFLVWLRAGSELPIGIVQQNITTIGEATMHKLAATNNKRLLLLAGSAAIVITIAVLHSWIANTVIAGGTGLLYKHGIEANLTQQDAALTNPMSKLYGTASSTYACRPQAPTGVPMTVNCDATMQAYGKLPQDDAGKQRALQNASAIEAALRAQGYHGGGNGVTLSGLIGGTYQGKDYNPDAYYEKVVDHRYDCIFDTMIAYSNPQPPAIRTQFWCTRTINLLGLPHNNLYQAGKGTPVY